FRPEDIKVPVFLWHAEDDTTVDISCAKRLASAIPNCQTHYLKEGGHYIFFSHFNEITEAF
ncbi:MAG: alpha/beta hydrolase, partial [Ghiorsea sp.]|nr:alpha/beta hydrolase [Ghiorsea sp.]